MKCCGAFISLNCIFYINEVLSVGRTRAIVPLFIRPQVRQYIILFQYRIPQTSLVVRLFPNWHQPFLEIKPILYRSSINIVIIIHLTMTLRISSPLVWPIQIFPPSWVTWKKRSKISKAIANIVPSYILWWNYRILPERNVHGPIFKCYFQLIARK